MLNALPVASGHLSLKRNQLRAVLLDQEKVWQVLRRGLLRPDFLAYENRYCQRLLRLMVKLVAPCDQFYRRSDVAFLAALQNGQAPYKAAAFRPMPHANRPALAQTYLR